MNTDSNARYSSFIPVLVVILTLTLVQLVEIYGMIQHRAQIKNQIAHLDTLLPQAKRAQKTLMELSQELLLLAPDSAVARGIVRDFRIQPVPPRSVNPE
ncbi:MAG: hypothetical protein ACFCUX_00980 [Candidatus Methylacidiphilales bacterium]